ncbi:MAG: dihydroneopterin aldolase [Pseudomonadota bacterium]
MRSSRKRAGYAANERQRSGQWRERSVEGRKAVGGEHHSDSILVQGIEFEASHGYTASERRQTRRFRCTIEVEMDLSAAGRTDRVQDTADYRALCALVVEIGTQRVFRLIEALAAAIAEAIQQRHPGSRVTVYVEKMAPPCPGAPASAGVRITRGGDGDSD